MKILALKFIYRSFKKSDSEFMRMGNQCYYIEASLNALKPNGNWISSRVQKVRFSAAKCVSFVHWFQPWNIVYRRIYHSLGNIHQPLSRLNWYYISKLFLSHTEGNNMTAGHVTMISNDHVRLRFWKVRTKLTSQTKHALWKDLSMAIIRSASFSPGSGQIGFPHLKHFGEWSL